MLQANSVGNLDNFANLLKSSNPTELKLKAKLYSKDWKRINLIELNANSYQFFLIKTFKM